MLKSIDKGSFIDMLKTAGAGDSERTNKKSKNDNSEDISLSIEFLWSLYLKE